MVRVTRPAAPLPRTISQTQSSPAPSSPEQPLPARTAPLPGVATRAAAVRKPPYDPGRDAKELYESMHGGMFGSGTDEERLFKALDGKTPAQIDALRREYRAHYKRDLDGDIRGELSGSELGRAEALLKGNQAAADADRLNVAISGAGTDEAAIVSVLEGKNQGQIDAIKSSYASQHGESLESALRGDLSGPSLARAEALLRGDRASADAAALNEAMKGAGTDENAVYGVLSKKSAPEREAIVRSYGRMYGAGSSDRALERHLGEELSSAELDRASSLLAGDQIGADAARVRHAMKGGLFGAGTDTQEIQDTFAGRSPEDRQAIVSAYGKYGNLDTDLREEMSRHELGKTRALIDRGKLTDTEALYYSVTGAGTDEDAIRSVLRGKSREQIDQLRLDYQRDFGRSLDGDLSGDLSGRDKFDVDQLLKGKPKTLDEALERANEAWQFERGGVSNDFSRSFMDDLSPDKGELLDRNMLRANELRDRARSEGRDLSASERAELEKTIGWVDMDVDTYRTAKDSAADAAGTVAATAASIAVVVGTAGAAAPVVVALAAAGAGAGARVATKAAIQGAGYGVEEGLADGAIGAVDGAFSAVGANAGTSLARSALQSSAKTALTRAGIRNASEEVVELAGRELVERSVARRVGLGALEAGTDGLVGGAAAGATQEALRDGAWDHGFTAGMERVFSGAGTGAVLGAGAGGVVGGGMGVFRGASGFVDESKLIQRYSEGSNHWNTIGKYDDVLLVNRALDPRPAALDIGSQRVAVYGARTPRELENMKAALERMEAVGAGRALPSEIHIRTDVGTITDTAGRRLDDIAGLGGDGQRMVVTRAQLRDPTFAAHVIHHEAGHNVDTLFGGLSRGKGASLFGVGDSVSSYGAKNALEDFAETHRVLMRDWEKITGQPDLFINNGTDIGRKYAFILEEAYGIKPGASLPPPLPRSALARPHITPSAADLPALESQLAEVSVKLPKLRQKLAHQQQQLDDLLATNSSIRRAAYENPGHHDPASPNFRGGGDMTTHLPPDAEAVYARAIPEPGQKGDIWWGRSESGDWYRFAGGERGVHWNGATGKTGGGRAIRDHEVPGAVKRQLQLEEDLARGRVKLAEMRERLEELTYERDYARLELEDQR